MVAVAPQHSADLGTQAQNIPPGPPPVRGPRPPVPGSFRGPHLDRQQQHNWPFFYVQPSQPYQPYQWPMPMPYVPYGGFPGMGYGMVVPPLPPAPYMDGPGYILPHAQLHMVDYRRMMAPHLAPHLAPSMAYQARRFRYQHTTPSGRIMVSSEVQTEPVGTESPQHGCKGSTSSQTSSESGRGVCSSSNFSSPGLHEDKLPEEPFEMPSNKTLADNLATASNVASVVSNSEILFQAEEVRIECRATTAECEEYLPACPDILMMGACPSSSTLEGTDGTPVEPGNSAEVHTLMVKGEDNLCGNSKILRLPFDLQCLDQLRQMEASVWSVESLVPYVPSAEWMIQNGLLTPQKPSLTPVMEVPAESPSEVPREADQTPTDGTSVPQDILQTEGVIELDGQDSLTSLESLPPYLPAASWLADFGNVYYSKLPSTVQQELGNLRTWPEGQLGQKAEVCEDSKVQSSVSPRSGSVHFKEERSIPKGRTAGPDLSDQPNCPVPSRSVKPLPAERKARICKSCLLKQKGSHTSGSPSPRANCKRQHKISHLAGDKTKVHLCTLCLCDPEKKAKCKANAAVSGLIGVDDETEGEVSENSLNQSAGPKKRAADGQKRLYNNTQKGSSGRHSERCPMSHQSKLREQNCSCDDPKGLPNSSPPWNSNGRGRCGSATEENMAVYAAERWRETEQRFISQKQKERSWRGSVQGSDTESIKHAGKMRTHNKPKQHAPAPDIHRRDTRC